MTGSNPHCQPGNGPPSEAEERPTVYVKAEPGALAFPGIMDGPVRRGNFNKLSGWPHAVEAIGTPGLHFHDLRHLGNQFAANGGAGLRDLMVRMGRDSERVAMIYQHEARGADKAITDAIDPHVDDARPRPTKLGDEPSTSIESICAYRCRWSAPHEALHLHC
jgi:hypothetical protein